MLINLSVYVCVCGLIARKHHYTIIKQSFMSLLVIVAFNKVLLSCFFVCGQVIRKVVRGAVWVYVCVCVRVNSLIMHYQSPFTDTNGLLYPLSLYLQRCNKRLGKNCVHCLYCHYVDRLGHLQLSFGSLEQSLHKQRAD